MALLTDGSPNTVESLKAIESAIADVAAIEMIDLSVKMDFALEQIGETLLAYLIQLGTKDPQYATRRQLGVSSVVVTAPLRRWHALLSVAAVYRDAYHNQLNDRYLAKWKYFNAAADDQRKLLMSIGLGLVYAPVPKAAQPVTGIAVGQWPVGAYTVVVTWVDANGHEGAASDPLTVELTSPGAPMVQVNAAPAGIAGWNLYVGPVGGGPLTLQNSTLLGFSVPFVTNSAGMVSGPAPGDGQSPDRYLLDNQAFFRG